ncbi:homeodomain-like protein [Tanacetum coccineum]|uniref:Homeodomain-like protein n=1 Tax=Tanacetum coccineum TaxID=301880 RepID=A0ABQ5EG47_9ASTR
MTRSSTSKLFTPYKEPEREFQSLRRHFKTLSLEELRSSDFNLLSDQEYSEEEEAEAMAETMEQYISKTRTDYGSGQESDETLFQAWECFKELLMKCPQHYLTKMQETAEDAKNVIQEMEEYSQNGREIKKVNEKVYAAQVGCKQCKGPHYTKDCPQKEEGKTLEEAYYTQFGGPFQGGGYRATAPGYYQRNKVNLSYQERRQSMEDTLSKFMSESAKRHEENSNLIKEI